MIKRREAQRRRYFVGLCRAIVSVRTSLTPSHRNADYVRRRNTGDHNRRRGIVAERRPFDFIVLTRVLFAASAKDLSPLRHLPP
ncbi:MAG: hypothetical protein K1V84_09715 [Muribaculaceae bacterium]